ncbi:MAG: DUF167 family protein [Verrucomicrobiota bacterium]|nr:DUF167 family protein [Verrucomicrobiota bacterium]
MTPDIRVYCHASRDEIDVTSEAAQLKVRVTASPIDSAANKAVLKFTASLAAHPDPRSR